MNLLIDIGNTRVERALARGAETVALVRAEGGTGRAPPARAIDAICVAGAVP